MKNLFKFFRGNGKKQNQKQLIKDLIKSNETLNINVNDKLFDLLEENSKLKDKYYKLDSENKDTLKLIELREKDIKNLEKNVKQEKSIREMFNNLDNKLSYAIDKMNSLEDIIAEFKGNIYEIKRVRSCTGTKQKLQIKSSSKKSSIIKKVVDNDEEEQQTS